MVSYFSYFFYLLTLKLFVGQEISDGPAVYHEGEEA